MRLLLVNTAATLYMTGVIWFVQLVHYPLFAAVGRTEFAAYHTRHSTLTTLAVGLPMLVELGTAAWLVAARPAPIPSALAVAGLILALAAFGLTFVVSVPIHTALDGAAADQVPPLIRSLVATNWLRTAVWTAHAGIVLWMLDRCLRAVPGQIG